MAGSNTGRPTVMTEEVLNDLRQAFLLGATRAEACGYAKIGERTLYDYLKANPEFSQQITDWQNEPILKARRKVVEDLDKDVKNAQWYLERKRKKEFSTRSELEQTGDNSVAEILKAAGLTGGVKDDRKDDGDPKGTPKKQT